MRPILKMLLLIMGSALLSGYGCRATDDSRLRPGAVTQVSTIDALLAGVYDGSASLAELDSVVTRFLPKPPSTVFSRPPETKRYSLHNGWQFLSIVSNT